MIRMTALRFRYWEDEDGNDGMAFNNENHTLLFHITHVPEVEGRMPVLPDGMEFPAAGLVQTLFEQDYRAIVTQGWPADRTIERLGTTDRGIILLRRMVMEGIEAAADFGREVKGCIDAFQRTAEHFLAVEIGRSGVDVVDA